jgi:predicted ATPase/two-component sensor histidine kinase
MMLGLSSDLLSEDDGFRLIRSRGDAPVLVQELHSPAPAANRARLAHAFSLRDLLDSSFAVLPKELLRDGERCSLLLEDPGGEPLSRLTGKPWAMAPFLKLALGLAAALRQLHARGVVHKDVKPAHVFVNLDTGLVRLHGFGIATRSLRERPSGAPESISGTHAYMAPEQTGRMNRSVDSRCDLYSLGVTLYELSTGTLPFSASEPIEWIHCHVARRPTPPHEREAGVPAAVSAIVMKLLSKTAEDRYQTAAGVEADLRRCLREWEAGAHIELFPLGAHDVPERFLVPEKLYGRETEVDALLQAFERASASGRPELVLVAGYSGVGKSSVVNELHKALVRRRGFFAAGKFDQYKRDIPYSTVAQAFQGLVRQVLARDEERVAAWRSALVAALGSNGQLVVNLVPELELVIGKQPPVAELPPEDAQSRFHLAFRRFVGVFAQREHPLALFLDDLQWLDRATLDLIEHLVTAPEARHLLLIGAYRDNEVDANHPLVRKLEAIRKTDAKLQELVLLPLRVGDVETLIADALRVDRDSARPLAELVHVKTDGNPFFAIQFLGSLNEEGLLAFDDRTLEWRWDLERIRGKGYTDNVVDLMAGKLDRLPERAHEVLRYFACVGSSAQASLLAAVCGASESEIAGALGPVVDTGLVYPHGDRYFFLHDRVREAAYALIAEVDRPRAHLAIGRALWARKANASEGDDVFELVNQLNRGLDLIDSEQERARLVELNLAAGRRARDATAHASALTYLSTARASMGENSFREQHEKRMALELDLAECAFLSGDLAGAEERLSHIAAHAENDLERAAIARLHVTVATALDRPRDGLLVCLEYLKRQGIEWTLHPSRTEVEREYAQLVEQLGDRSIESLIDLPRLSDPSLAAQLDVLNAMLAPAIFVDENLNALALCRVVNLSLRHGNSDAAAVAYVMLARILGPYFGDPKAAFRFGKLAFDLVERPGFDRYKARVSSVFGLLVNPWHRHVATSEPLARRAFEIAQTTGDLTFAAYSCTCLITIQLAAGFPLDGVQTESESALDFAHKSKFGQVVEMITGQLQLVRTLRGLTPDFASFDEPGFDEDAFEARLENPSLVMAACWYWVRKLQGRFLAGEYREAIEAAAKASALLWTSGSFLEFAEYQLYAGLSHAANHDASPASDRATHREALVAHQKKVEEWSENCPENFACAAALLAAELARIEARELDAMHLYETAIRAARDGRLVHHEAFAYERAGKFYDSRRFERIARVYLENAHACYVRWGALGKASRLAATFPGLGQATPLVNPPEARSEQEQLDLRTVVKTSQAVSEQVGSQRVIESLMAIALEHAGAERGILLLREGEELFVQADAATAGDGVRVEFGKRASDRSTLPASVLNYVLRTREAILLDDALAPHPFSEDEYFAERRCRSVLCLPLLKQTDVVGVLYLENNLSPGVFTQARLDVLKLLASQGVISLENAALGEKDALLKEVHHRVKNNLQLISSLLNLQAARVSDPEVAELFADCRNRVRSMALVHENLYRAGNFSKISMTSHVQSLCAQLSRAYASSKQPAEVNVNVGDFYLDMNPAITCGLIINELVSNALKHGFSDGRAGRIEVTLREAGTARYELSVSDNGVGMPPGLDLAKADTLGLQLVHDLAEQLHGKLEIDQVSGTTFRIRFGEGMGAA